MSTVVIKTIRGRQYRYLQESHRVNGKVVTTSIYLGPLAPKRHGGGFGTLFPNLVLGAAMLAGHAVKGNFKTRHYKEKPYVDQRARSIAEKAIRELDRRYAIDKTNADTFNASRARLPKEMLDEYERAQLKAAVPTEKKSTMSPDMKEFAERVASRSTASEAPAADEDDAES
jgi:hypothetical protein